MDRWFSGLYAVDVHSEPAMLVKIVNTDIIKKETEGIGSNGTPAI